MRIGTPGFQGERLREARDVRSLTAIALSEMVDVSAQQVYNYENGKSTPSPETFSRIAASLNLPEEFFLIPARTPGGDRKVFYRSLSSATKGARNRAERRFSWLEDITDYVTQFVELPTVNLPDFQPPANPSMLSSQDVENVAEELRAHWRMGDGPVSDVVRLLENHGAVVARDQLGADTLDSLSTFANSGRPLVGVGIDKGTPVRWRFDAAHELGHLILHQNIEPNFLNRSAEHKLIEEQAHRFAAAFLVPLGPFSNDLFGLSLDSLRAVKPKWKVSIGMMIIRARHAGILSEEAERKLWISYNRRKWRRNEPYDDSMIAEEPEILRRSIELILDEGEQTPADILSRLSLASTDVEALTNLKRGFLDSHTRVTLKGSAADPPGTVISLDDRRNSTRR